MSEPIYTLHVISHTHWDREWYQPFVGYQRRLVFLMDRLLNLLEKQPDFRAFYLDGQTCMLDDYLAIRPEAETRLRQYLSEGRLEMGPWFVMPDELLVSGEALIRNLEIGILRCREMGCDPSPLLHASDVFGHCSQMPQIMQEFGIDKTMLLRGTCAEDEQSEMVWTGADGSRVWILKVFPDTGYCDIWTYRREKNADKLQAYEKRKIELSTTPHLIGLDGNDHQAPFGPILQSIADMNSAFERTKVRHSSVSEALHELNSFLDFDDPQNRLQFAGELRTPAKTGQWNEVFFGTASARIPTKQKNDHAQIMLSRVAEPLQALASLVGGTVDRSFLDRAWEYLLKCHPHDSIVGCSTDQVDRDVHYRLDQTIELASDQAGEALFHLASHAAVPTPGTDTIGHLFLFNPSSSVAGPTIEIEIEVPHDPKRKREAPPILSHTDGKVVTSSLQLENRGVFPSPIGRRIENDDYPRYGCRAHETGPVDRWKGVVHLTLPALGTTTLNVLKGKRKAVKAELPKDSCVQRKENSFQFENQHLRLSVNPDATIDLKDKKTGQQFPRLGQFEFQHDRGNGWDFKPINPSTDSSKQGEIVEAHRVRISFQQQDDIRHTVVVSGQLRLPSALNAKKDRSLRSQVTIPFQHTLTLDAGASSAKIQTRIDNTARDMRLRLILPTQLKVDCWWSDSAFDSVKRTICLPSTEGWKEKVRPETPFHSWVAVCGSGIGFSVITEGLQEACVLDQPDHPIALTVLRCYRQKIGSGETQDTQQQGLFEAVWHLGTFEPNEDEPGPEVFKLADRCRIPVQSITLNPAEMNAKPSLDGHTLPTLDGNLELSAFRTNESGLVLRLFNPHSIPHEAEMHGVPDKACFQQVTLKGQKIGESIIPQDTRFAFQLKPKEIQTWKFTAR